LRVARFIALVFVALTIACGGSSPTTPTTASTGRIVVLGDSLAVSPSRSQNFVSELQSRINQSHPGWALTNEGVIGDTTAGGLNRIDGLLAARPQILVLELGANDGLQGISTTTVERNLSTMIERSRSAGVRVLLCGMQTLPTHGLTYALEFPQIYPRLSSQYNVPLVPFLLEGVVLNPDLNLSDGLHPNAAGARAVANTVWPYLEPMLLSVPAR
jgi:acyl-CoA thioesterase I